MSVINGINHILLICKDMNKSVEFYCNILGFKPAATSSETVTKTGLDGRAPDMPFVSRIYHLATQNGTMISLAELPRNDTTADGPLFLPNFWPGDSRHPKRPSKMDHIALDVDSRDDLIYFQKRLRDHGIEVSEIYERPPTETTPMFVKSIYFSDPDGIPLEIASWDRGDPNWQYHKDENMHTDPNPVPSLHLK
jgi:catechol 2,3-dioxygenase-like lactoylglutathione lyase family enzyme